MRAYRVISTERAKELTDIARSLEWSVGKARTKELTGTVKCNEEILQHTSLDTLGKQILLNPSIQLDHIPLQLHAPKYSRYQVGQHYKRHTDSPWMAATRTDLSCTLWLNDDYEGGELVINGQRHKRKPGECIIYNCEDPHEVLPVTSGERICVITWIQSRIRDPHRRLLISDMRKFLSKIEDDKDLFLEGSRLYSMLLRMWSE